ncbi:MAG: hypothetical protein K2W86_14795 [Sphingomonas sp.]|uniref:hypothetical protein n=1 Tax=Sphingomonas sp. TaxID=28214 RepID=UPI0035A8406B|nr:hypothetical protein [Sphingomonas sp.]
MPQQSPIRVTDHALLRWLERAGLVDVEALRAQIEAQLERGHKAAAALGAEQYTIVAHGLVYTVNHNHVTTVLIDKGSGSWSRNQHFRSDRSGTDQD